MPTTTTGYAIKDAATGALPVAQGGTAATNAADARTSLGAGDASYTPTSAEKTSLTAIEALGTGVMKKTGTGTYGAVTAPSGDVVGTSDTQTLTNKRITKRIGSVASAAEPTINTDNYDGFDITALAAAITSMTTNLTGTPVNGDIFIFTIKDDGTARAIAWGAAFTPGGVALPTTTVLSKILTVGFRYSTANALNKWCCIASSQEA